MVRVYAFAGRQNKAAGWDTDYVRNSCNILGSTDVVKVLGGYSGSDAQIKAKFVELCKKVEELHKTIDHVEDAATELVLNKSSADVSKIVHTLRLNGDRLASSSGNFSQMMRESLARTLGAELVDTSWRQATCGNVGLGLRTAEEIALPAFIASCTAAAPGLRQIFARLESAGLAPAGALDAAYTLRTANAVTALQNTFDLDAPQRDKVTDVINAGKKPSEQWW